MSFKNMKIRVDDTNRAGVRKALEDAGYEFVESVEANKGYSKAAAFTTYEHGKAYFIHADEFDGCFDEHSNKEHFLFNGQFVTKGYFTYPETEYAKRFPCKGCRPGECSGCGDGVFVEVPEVDPPAPLLSKQEHDKARMKDILAAMQRYVSAGKFIPNEWTAELGYLNNLQEN